MELMNLFKKPIPALILISVFCVLLGGCGTWKISKDEEKTNSWGVLYDTNHIWAEPRYLGRTEDGGYLVAGFSNRFFLLKLDNNGNIVLEKSYGKLKNPDSVIRSHEGGLVITKAFDEGIRIINLDREGNRVWERTYYCSLKKSDKTKAIAALTADGGFLIGANTHMEESYDSNFLILKLDRTGKKIWEKNVLDERGGDIEYIYPLDHGFIIHTFDGGRHRIIMIDSEGKSYNIYSRFEYFESIRPIKDHGFVMIGCAGGYFPIGLYYIHSNSDLCVSRFDKDGDKIWRRRYGGPSVDCGYDIHPTKDGGYLAIGEITTSMKLEHLWDPAGFFGPEEMRVWIIKLDKNGYLIWQRTLGEEVCIGEIAHIIETDDGGYAIAAPNDFKVNKINGIWIIKLDHAGRCAGPGCP